MKRSKKNKVGIGMTIGGAVFLLWGFVVLLLADSASNDWTASKSDIAKAQTNSILCIILGIILAIIGIVLILTSKSEQQR